MATVGNAEQMNHYYEVYRQWRSLNTLFEKLLFEIRAGNQSAHEQAMELVIEINKTGNELLEQSIPFIIPRK